MNILHVVKWDPAADVVRCVGELNKYSKHSHRMIGKELHPFQSIYQFPEYPIRTEFPGDDFDWADAILYHHLGWEDTWDFRSKPCAFRNLCIYHDRKEDKFWTSPEYNAKSLDSYKLLSSSHKGAMDFLDRDKFLWLPDLIPMDEYTPDYSYRPPCFSYIKHSNEIHEGMFPGMILQNLHHKPLATVIRERRTKATIVIDNFCDGHWGLAGMESVSMGLPTLVYNNRISKESLEELGCDPFIEADDLVIVMGIAREVDRTSYRQGIRSKSLRAFDPPKLIDDYWDPFFSCLLCA